ncbi:MAG TPA: hypothetical protein VLJ68_02105 [Chitinophagaceae bacterium]|nr:hypothetical protein [Chitinophagaceae bacterium]
MYKIKNHFLSAFLLLISMNSFSQTETFDIATYTAPKDFKKVTNQGVITYSQVNTTQGIFCVIAMYPSSASTGDVQKDFDRDWKDLVVTPFGADANPKTETETTPDGWKLVTGAAPIKMNGIDCTIMLNVISGFGKTISFRTSLNDQSYSTQIDALFGSMELDKTVTSSVNNNNTSSVQAGAGGEGKYGAMIYTPPVGWSEQLYSNGVLFKPLDITGNEYMAIQLMQSLNATGTLEQAIAQSWEDALVMYKGSAMYQSGGKYSKNASQKSYNGWEYIRGKGGIRVQDGSQFGTEYGMELFVIKINNRFERVAIMDSRQYCGGNSLYYTSDRRPYRNSIEHLLFSLHFSDFNGPVLSPGSLTGSGVVGVWQGTMQSTSASGVRLEVMSPIFLSNGQVYFGSKFPLEGLNGINSRLPAQLNNRDWGTYTSGAVKMPYASIPFRMQGKELIFTKNQTDWPFYELPSVDGATFNGTYVMSAVNGVIPSITFTSSGNFTDRGALKQLYHEYINCLNPAVAPGSGQYTVKDYSIVFSYSDGRKIVLAFLGAGYDKSNPSPPSLRMSFQEDPLTRQ